MSRMVISKSDQSKKGSDDVTPFRLKAALSSAVGPMPSYAG
jgi:hypothetical protein